MSVMNMDWSNPPTTLTKTLHTQFLIHKLCFPDLPLAPSLFPNLRHPTKTPSRCQPHFNKILLPMIKKKENPESNFNSFSATAPKPASLHTLSPLQRFAHRPQRTSRAPVCHRRRRFSAAGALHQQVLDQRHSVLLVGVPGLHRRRIPLAGVEGSVRGNADRTRRLRAEGDRRSRS